MVSVVTASTRGIGRAIALKLLEETESKVILNYVRDESFAGQFKKELESRYPGRTHFIKANLSTYEGLDEFSKRIYEYTDHIDYLVLNAGTFNRKLSFEITVEEWNLVMDTNLSIPFFTVKNLYNLLNNNGSVLFISSVMGTYPHSGSVSYGVSKAGINHMAKMLVKELRGKNISVNAVGPGFVVTDLFPRDRTKEQIDSLLGKIAAHQFQSPELVAQLVVSVLKNPAINGQVINIDGGYCFV